MSDIREIPYDEIRSLLECEELKGIQEVVSKTIGVPIAPDSNPAVTLQIAMIEVSLSGLSCEQLREILANDHELIVKFGSRFLSDELFDDDEQEYPLGEENDADGEKMIIGLGKGFPILLAINVHLLRDRSDKELTEYLNSRRIPHASRFTEQLRSIFEDVAKV